MNERHDDLSARRQLHELRSQWQQALDADVAQLDASVAARLEQARAIALQNAAASDKRRFRLMLSAPVAIAAMLLLALWMPGQLQLPAESQRLPAASYELSELEPWQEDTELLNELEFYTWLELEAEHAS
jgi:DNA segregation ATPase FtsK/SpoIIIE-like protein